MQFFVRIACRPGLQLKQTAVYPAAEMAIDFLATSTTVEYAATQALELSQILKHRRPGNTGRFKHLRPEKRNIDRFFLDLLRSLLVRRRN